MGYRRIVAVINEHTSSTLTARYAMSLAEACKAELLLYAINGGESGASLHHHANHHLEHSAAVATDMGIPVSRIIESGSLSLLLPKRVEKEEVDLVFYPLAPGESYGTRLQQQTVHHLLRTISADLAITRTVTMAKPHPRHILMPLGKTVGEMERRLLFIAELARCFHAEVMLFHLTAGNGGKSLPDDVSQFRQKLKEQHIPVQARSGRGVFSKAIAVEAISRHSDLIIIGASGRGLLRRLFYGNLAGDVMHLPPCNTILFRAAL